MDCWAPRIVRMYRIVFLIFGSLLLRCAAPAPDRVETLPPYYNEPSFTPHFTEAGGARPASITHTIGAFNFLNQDSVMISDEDIAGKIHVANFMFTSCGSICPAMTRNLQVVSDSVGDDADVLLLSFSVTPWIDRPGVLRKYKADHGIANARWHFLTGSRDRIYRLARQSYFAEEDIGFTRDSTEFLHTEHVVLVDRDKHIRGIYNGTLLVDMYDLIHDIRLLKNHSARDK